MESNDIFLWNKTLTGIGITSVSYEEDCIFVAGSHLYDAYLAKWDLNGNVIWQKYLQINEDISTYFEDIVVTQSSIYAITADYFIKFDKAGTLIWKNFVRESQYITWGEGLVDLWYDGTSLYAAGGHEGWMYYVVQFDLNGTNISDYDIVWGIAATILVISGTAQYLYTLGSISYNYLELSKFKKNYNDLKPNAIFSTNATSDHLINEGWVACMWIGSAGNGLAYSEWSVYDSGLEFETIIGNGTMKFHFNGTNLTTSHSFYVIFSIKDFDGDEDRYYLSFYLLSISFFTL